LKVNADNDDNDNDNIGRALAWNFCLFFCPLSSAFFIL
jgi:hypothetical protein